MNGPAILLFHIGSNCFWIDLTQMETGSSQVRGTARSRQMVSGRGIAMTNSRWIADRPRARGDVTMKPEASSGYRDSAAARPIAELLACPPAVANLLNASAECIEFEVGDTIFRQSAACRGLYVVIAGQLLKKTERLEKRLTLGTARAGDLVELAAALGDVHHTYSLTAQSRGSVLLLPLRSLQDAFESYPPLRMQLLEELAREVSRAYSVCCTSRLAGIRHRASVAPHA